MRFLLLASLASIAFATGKGKVFIPIKKNAYLICELGFTFPRLNKTNAVLLVVDHQLGLSTLVRDVDPTVFRQSVIGHTALGKLFNLPTILTTSADTGPNGRLPKEITEMYQDAPFIHRQGEVDAWDNPDFRAAVEATGKKLCLISNSKYYLTFSKVGYEVWANTDASGTFNPRLAADANRRMEQAGVQLMGLFGITMDLMRDWRNTPGTAEVLPYLDQYLVPYSLLARNHGYAIENGTLVPGEQQIL
ncbi:Isochorismatase-like protein [Xylogone sp. PMI_703]|nr:Isochorismatase-like protein [Xylogone sp. PMI_703]